MRPLASQRRGFSYHHHQRTEHRVLLPSCLQRAAKGTTEQQGRAQIRIAAHVPTCPPLLLTVCRWWVALAVLGTLALAGLLGVCYCRARRTRRDLTSGKTPRGLQASFKNLLGLTGFDHTGAPTGALASGTAPALGRFAKRGRLGARTPSRCSCDAQSARPRCGTCSEICKCPAAYSPAAPASSTCRHLYIPSSTHRHSRNISWSLFRRGEGQGNNAAVMLHIASKSSASHPGQTKSRELPLQRKASCSEPPLKRRSSCSEPPLKRRPSCVANVRTDVSLGQNRTSIANIVTAAV